MSNKNDLTEREKELMALAWLCFNEKPKPDYKKLASLAGMSNPVSASNAWSRIQKKITAQAGAVSDGNGTPEVSAQVTPKPTPKKRGAAAAKVANGEGEGEESPGKKAKGKTGRKVVVKKEVGEEDGEGDAAGSEEGDESFF